MATNEYSLKTAMISGAMGVSQKDIYLYYLVFVQVLCMSLLVWMNLFAESSAAIDGLFA